MFLNLVGNGFWLQRQGSVDRWGGAVQDGGGRARDIAFVSARSYIVRLVHPNPQLTVDF